MKLNDETIREAVKLWLKNESEAINKYGHIKDWDTSEVTDMSSLFENAESFNQPIGNWDTSNVISMKKMFWQAKSFNQPIGNWNVSKVTDMNMMFTGASSFNQPLGNWDVSKVTNMIMMFFDAESFNQPIGSWNINSRVTKIDFMFINAESFNQPIDNWDVSTKSYEDQLLQAIGDISIPLEYNQFDRDKFLHAIEKWNEDKEKAESKYGPLESWDLSLIEVFGKEERQQNKDNREYIYNQLTDFKEYTKNGDNSFEDITMSEFLKILDEKEVYIINDCEFNDRGYYQYSFGKIEDRSKNDKFDVEAFNVLFEYWDRSKRESIMEMKAVGKYNPLLQFDYGRVIIGYELNMIDKDRIKEIIDLGNIKDLIKSIGDQLTITDLFYLEEFSTFCEEPENIEVTLEYADYYGSIDNDMSWFISDYSNTMHEREIRLYIGDKKIKL
ncbi:MAG: DUF285 domain-containing protein [Oceanospirillaceae bacterium]|nr:DUF285 domain-containing protein [Oceanospirillaceae bacterium]